MPVQGEHAGIEKEGLLLDAAYLAVLIEVLREILLGSASVRACGRRVEC